MNICVLYVSHTGNTKRLAEALAEKLRAPMFNAASSAASDVEPFDLLVVGTPVMGLKPAPELLSFVEKLPAAGGKRAVLFSTYAFAQGGALKVLEQKLAVKGYRSILSVGKRGVKPGKADFQDVLDKVSRAVKA
jgi:flavodoxin